MIRHRILLVVYIVVFCFSAYSMDFDMGTIEVHEIKAVIDQDDFSEKSKFVFDENKENILTEDAIKKDIDLSDELSGLTDYKKSTWIKLIIGDDSLEDMSVGYEQKQLNYLWKGDYRTFNQDVYRLPSREVKKDQLRIMYDDSYGSLNFSTDSIFSEDKSYLAGPDINPGNSYFVNHKKTYLSGNFYTPVIRGWNLSGFIDLEKKEIRKEYTPIDNGTYDDKMISLSGQKEFDIWKNIFLNLELNVDFDEIDFKGMKKDADGFSINSTFNITNKDFSLISRLDIFEKGIKEKAAFSVEYIRYLHDNNIFGIIVGREYKNRTYPDIYFSDNVVLTNNLLDVMGEENDMFDVYYEFTIAGWSSKVTLGASSISDLLYFYDKNSNDRRVYPAYMNDLDRNRVVLEASKQIDDISMIKLEVNSNDDKDIVPYVPENRIKVDYSLDYSDRTYIDIALEFIGEYYNKTVGGLKNDRTVLVDFDFKHKINENTSLLLSVNNILDDDNNIKPGFSEIGRNIELGIEHLF